MKKIPCLCLCLTLVFPAVAKVGVPSSATVLPADPPASYAVVERGPHHRVWSRVTWQTNAVGKARGHTNSFTELETGMHYLKGGQWLESKAEIELLADGAAATNGPHQVFFAANLNTVGAIDLTTPDGKRLRSRVFGLSYFDASSGKAVLIGETKDSIGLLVGANEVRYTNAFAGVEADVQYFYTKAGFEQNIVLRTQPPGPSAFGLNPATTRLQVLTEFYDPPMPAKTTEIQAAGIVDEFLDFGAMTMGRGRAFSVGAAGETVGSVPVTKQWGVASGRTFLVEEVPFKLVEQQIQVLERKQRGASLNPRRQAEGTNVIAALQGVLPQRRAKASAGKMRMAQLETRPRAGFVLDYTLLSSSTNYTFKGDTTYYISGNFSMFGTNTFEDGAVIKYATNGTLQITPGPPGIGGPWINWLAGPYRPVVFTAIDDNSVGETITDSTGNPAGYYGNPMLYMASIATPALTGFRMAYAKTAITFSGASANVYDAQFVNCQNGLNLGGATVLLGNALFTGTKTNFIFGGGSSVSAQNVTFDGAIYVATAAATPSGSTLALTNCLLVNVTNLTLGNYDALNGSYNGFHNSLAGSTFGSSPITSAVYPLQTVGAGAHYLTANGAFQNAGTTNINAALAKDLQEKTTYPPLVYSNQFITTNLLLFPQAQRDTDTPDLGYHYDPLDYAFGAVWVSNATVTVFPGTAIGMFSAGYGLGIGLMSGSKFYSQGTPTAPNWIARYHLVQEQANLTWTNGYSDYSVVGNWLGGTAPEIRCSFTKWSAAAGANWQFGDINQALPMWFKDCEFHGGKFRVQSSSLYVTNSLFNRVATILSEEYGPRDVDLRNCLFSGGQLYLGHFDSGTWTVTDNLFDQPAISQDGQFNTDYNGYTTTNRISPPGAHDLVTNLTYVAGPLGAYYQPTNSAFINRGSVTNAGLVGLYHYTLTTNLVNGWEIKETNSVVDIGYHYVAVDTNGLPVDTDGGGAPDYMEDSNGNGTVDSGETDWTSSHGSDDFNHLLVPGYLRCEYRVDPWGVDAKDPWTGQQRPRLYWIVTSPRRAEKQVAYQILVATDTNLLAAGAGDVWNSGKIFSDQTIHVEYKGNALQSGQRLWWKVRSWDLYTGLSTWSTTNGFFQMGLLTNTDWNGANWIGVTGYQSTKPCPMFRSQPFVLTNQIKNATAYVSAKGVYELWINGYRIGSNILAPEWTDYNVRIQYQTFDVTPYLTSGNTNSTNVIGAFVGKGWCFGPVTGNNYYFTGAPQTPQFLLRLNITNTNLTTTNFFTDGNWTSSTNGPIRTADIFAGETYDATQEGAATNWCTPSYTPVSFTNAVTPDSGVSNLVSQPNDPIQIVQYLQPIAMWTITNSDSTIATVYDLGQNMVGWCLLSLTNVANLSGTPVTLWHGEGLIPDSYNNGAFGPNNHAHVYLDNLGYAGLQQEKYILTNAANQQFHPHFTYHGFRFVEVTAPPAVANNLSLASLTGCVIRSGMPVTGAFWCSDSRACAFATNLVSKLMTNASWGIRGNLQGVLTACTQRHEREGYLYDTMSQAACFDVDMGAFLTKWLRDVRETQRLRTPDHDYTDYAPWDGLGIGTDYFDPGAQGSALVYPWRLYQNYGDTRMLAEQYRSVTNHIAYLAAKCNGSTWSTTNWDLNAPVQDWGSGDYFRWAGWYYTHPYGWPEGHAAGAMWRTWGTAWSAGSADLAAKMALVLKLEAQARNASASAVTYATDHTDFTSVAAKVRTAYTNDLVRFDGLGINNITSIWSSLPYNPPLYNGSWSSAQSDIMTALYFDMVPDSKRSNLVWLLINGPHGITNYNIGYTHDSTNTNYVCINHLSSGYYFAPRTLLELTRSGNTSKAYDVLVNTNFPSFLYPVVCGGTTFWEGWDSYLAGAPNPVVQNYYPSSPNDRGYYPLTAVSPTAKWIPFTSLNHGSFEEVATWIWQVVGGMNPDDVNPGFRNVIIKPEPGGGITNTFASFVSIHGPIVCTWTNNLSNSKYTLNVTNPANITASVYIPSTNNLAGILESGQPAASSPGVMSYYFTNWPNWTNGATVFQVGSGGYSFNVTNVSF